MFYNVGGKLQVFARISMWIGIVASVISGIVTWANSWSGGFLVFLLIAVFGSLGAYVSSLFLYAFGELVENVASIEYDTGYFRRNGAKPDEGTGKAPSAVSNTIKCPSCGKEQMRDGGICALCGSPLV